MDDQKVTSLDDLLRAFKQNDDQAKTLYQAMRNVVLNPTLTDQQVISFFHSQPWVDNKNLLYTISFEEIDNFVCSELSGMMTLSQDTKMYIMDKVIGKHYSEKYAFMMTKLTIFSYRFGKTGKSHEPKVFSSAFFDDRDTIQKVIVSYLEEKIDLRLDPLYLEFFNLQCKYNLTYMTEKILDQIEFTKNSSIGRAQLQRSQTSLLGTRIQTLMNLIQSYLYDVSCNVNYVSQLNDDQVNAMNMFSINSGLINETVRSISRDNNKWIRPLASQTQLLSKIDDIINNAPKTTRDHFFWRGTSLNNIDELRSDNDHQFVSTSLVFSEAKKYLRGNSCCLTIIKVPAGIPMLHIEHVRPVTGQPFEFVLPRSTIVSRDQSLDMSIITTTGEIVYVHGYVASWSSLNVTLNPKKQLRGFRRSSSGVEDSQGIVQDPNMNWEKTIANIPIFNFKQSFISDVTNYIFSLYNRGALKEQIIKRLEKIKQMMLDMFHDPNWQTYQSDPIFQDNLNFVTKLDVNKLYAYRNRDFADHFMYLDLMT